MDFPVEGLREEETIRSSSSKEQRNKILPGSSGAGDLDTLADVLLSSSTVSYADPRSTTPTSSTSSSPTLGASITGDSSE